MCITSPLSSLPPSLTLSFFLPSLSPDPVSSQRKRTQTGQEAACSRCRGRPLTDGVPAQQCTLPSVNCRCCCQERRRHGQELPAPCGRCLCRRARYLLGSGGRGLRTVVLSPQRPPPRRGPGWAVWAPSRRGLAQTARLADPSQGTREVEEPAWSLFLETSLFRHIWWQWDLA